MITDRTGEDDDTFAALLARVEAAEPAPESFRERLADAMAIELDSLGLDGVMSARASLYLADVAIGVLRGEGRQA